MPSTRCPICKRLRSDAPTAPFCSERCQTIDLARWLDGDYRFPEPEALDPLAPNEGDSD